MKKYVLIVISSFLCVYSINAFSQQAPAIWINGVGGFNNNWIFYQNAYGNPELEYSVATVNYTAGIGMNYLNNKWGAGISVLRNRMGQSYGGLQSGGDTKRKIKLSYVEVPLMIWRNIPFKKKPTWVTFGPDVFILSKATQEYQRTGGSELLFPERLNSGDITSRFNNIDVALTFAYCKMYSLLKTDKAKLFLSANTSIGISDINSKSWKIKEPDGNYSASHNFYVGIKAGIMFKVWKEYKPW